ncbi:1-acyl-sn-glycerol-3-phosphate acyltransferase [Candidatus Saganbacteria bacterium]|nr:1-acyl-sn-glycerol-3-phosphate acyltransferase [Candidatus Saganbacteria bacterium]
MRLVRSIIFYFALVASFFVGTFLAIILAMFSSPKDRYKIFQKTGRIWASFLAYVSGIPAEVSGLENIPKDEAVIFASNHQGAADILILLAFLPVNFAFIIKKELFSVPIFGWYLRQAKYVGVDRGTRKGAADFIKNGSENLKNGDHIMIFPEGTRSPDGNLQEFKRGSLILAFKAKVRVVPIAINGSYNILPKKSLLLNPAPVKMKIGKPISLKKFEGNHDLANKELREVIQSMLLR